MKGRILGVNNELPDGSIIKNPFSIPGEKITGFSIHAYHGALVTDQGKVHT